MENKTINLHTVAEVAKGLKELKDRMVFVGGAVISLYADDEAADEIRPTADVDMTIELSSYSEWVSMQERLAALKFSPNAHGHAICSYMYKGVSVDILPAQNSSFGASNSWYLPGFSFLKEVVVEGELIKILSAPYFMATKFEAFHGRGNGDYRTSHDFEDIIYVIDNRTSIIQDMLEAESLLKSFLQQEFKKVISHPHAQEIIRTQIHPMMVDERYPLVLEKIIKIIEG